jgi:hypothetical protein
VNTFVKLLVALAVLAGVGYFFVQSVKSTRSEPYAVPRGRFQSWTLTLERPVASTDPVVALRAPAELGAGLFRQIFERHAESLNSPSMPSMPLVLQEEYVRAFAGHTSPDALFAAAKAAGLATITLQPRCLAYRRVSAPGVTRQLYFLLFDTPQFSRFRRDIAKLAVSAGSGDVFDPDALSPVVVIAASDTNYGHWFPLKAEDSDCLAPITAE